LLSAGLDLVAPVTTADINNADEEVKGFYRVAEAWSYRQVSEKPRDMYECFHPLRSARRMSKKGMRGGETRR
jgi:hypothetical protein